MLFYPWAFSGVCSGELAEIRDRLADLQNDSTELLAISCDAMYSLRAFAERDGLTFSLLSDFWPHGEVARRYGIFRAEIGISDRATFILDRGGIIRWQVVNAIGEARNLDSYTKALTDLA